MISVIVCFQYRYLSIKKSLLSRLFLRFAVLITHRLYTGQGRDTSVRDAPCKGRIIQWTWHPYGPIVKGTQYLCSGAHRSGTTVHGFVYTVWSSFCWAFHSLLQSCPPFISEFSLREWRRKSIYYFCKLLSIEVLILHSLVSPVEDNFVFNFNILRLVLSLADPALQRKSDLCIPRKETARPQS